MHFSTILLALAASASSTVAANVTFLSPVAPGSPITQVYSVLTSLRRYYDTIDAKEGATLVVNGITVGPLANPGVLGTAFQFVPTKSAYTGYSGVNGTVYFGHVALASDPNLHLTVDQPSAAIGLIPYLSAASTTDDVTQLQQTWSWDSQTFLLTFLGRPALSTASPFSGPYAPAQPVNTTEKVRLVSTRDTIGKFYLGRLIN